MVSVSWLTSSIGEAVARELVAIGLDAQVPEARDLLDAHVLRAGHAAHGGGDAFTELREPIEIRAVDEHRHVGADAGDELVGAHLDGLRDAARNFGHGRFHGLRYLVTDLGLGDAGPPRERSLSPM